MLITTQITSITASPDTTVKVEPHENTAKIGDTFTVNITITDVQNLFGLEITLDWDSSILQVVNVDVRLGVESHPDGVLHEILPEYTIFIVKNETIQEEGTYQLVGTSLDRNTPSFNGSGNIARITFNVANAGSCALNLEAKLASKPLLGSVSSPITHTTVDGFFSTQEPEQYIWPYTTAMIAVIVIATVVTVIVMYHKRSKKAERKL